MQVVAEGGSLFGMDMTIVADGNSTLEHNVPLDTFYEDVLQFFPQTRTNYTPTLVVSYGGLAGDPYWRQATDVFAHPLLRAHTPPTLLLSENARRIKAPEDNFVDGKNAREAHKLAKRGVLVSIGAHGQQAGDRRALGTVVVRPRRHDADGGAARRHDRLGPLARNGARHRFARSRQARRSRRARRGPHRRHPQQRQGVAG
jgi:hypothetical protein